MHQCPPTDPPPTPRRALQRRRPRGGFTRGRLLTLILLAGVAVLAGPQPTATGGAGTPVGGGRTSATRLGGLPLLPGPDLPGRAIRATPTAAEPGAPSADAPPEEARPDWRLPLPGWPRVARGFAPGPARWSAGHRGVDLVGDSGVVVVAAGAGRVSFAAEIAGVGVIVVDHGSLRTTYQPVAAGVAEGTFVRTGQPLGRLSQRGSHCGSAACLHWGLLRGEMYLDPLTLVTPPRIRLLPFDQPLSLRARPG